MSNYMINSIFNEMSKVAVLSVKLCDDTYDRSDAAVEAGERFLKSAALLKKEQFLGLQIRRGEGRKSQACVFSSIDAGVTAEDLGWMFQGCADIGSFSADASVIRHDTSNKIYELRRTPGNSGEQHDGCGSGASNQGDSISGYYFRQLLDEMEKTDAAIQISAGVTHDGMVAGAITLSLPDEMTLRMQTMLSLAFPNTKVSRISESDENPADNGIPMRYLLEGTSAVLIALMDERCEEEAAQKAHDGDD